MLNDRSYMNNRNDDPDGRSAGGIQAVWGLIIANLVCYFLLGQEIKFALSPAGIRAGYYFQIVSAMFMHYDFFHLFFNMFSLYIFGMLASPILGARRFLILYFVSGVVGNVLWLTSVWNSAAPTTLLGASGAVMGVIIASAMLMPNVDMFILFIPFPVKLRTMAVVFILIELFSQLTGRGGGIAYLAHIGGFIGGYLVMRLFFRRFIRWDPLGFLGGSRADGAGSYTRRPPPPGWTVRGDDRYAPPPPPPSGRVTQQELDMLLDKISARGINSLSEDELTRLRQAREQMRGGK